MTANEITIHAYNATYPNEPMNMPEMLLYMTMRVITLEFKYGIIGKDTASTLKTKAIADYKSNLVDYQNGIDCAHRIADLYKRIELATSTYRLDKTIDNADKLMEAIYGQSLR